MSINFFFQRLLEVHAFDFGMRFVLLGRTLVRHLTFCEERAIGGVASVGHLIVALQELGQIRHVPELSVSHTGFASEQLGGRILMQLVLQGFDLLGAKPGAIASLPMIEEGGQSSLLIGMDPVLQCTVRASADIEDLFDRIPGSIQTDA